MDKTWSVTSDVFQNVGFRKLVRNLPQTACFSYLGVVRDTHGFGSSKPSCGFASLRVQPSRLFLRQTCCSPELPGMLLLLEVAVCRRCRLCINSRLTPQPSRLRCALLPCCSCLGAAASLFRLQQTSTFRSRLLSTSADWHARSRPSLRFPRTQHVLRLVRNTCYALYAEPARTQHRPRPNFQHLPRHVCSTGHVWAATCVGVRLHTCHVRSPCLVRCISRVRTTKHVTGLPCSFNDPKLFIATYLLLSSCFDATRLVLALMPMHAARTLAAPATLAADASGKFNEN